MRGKKLTRYMKALLTEYGYAPDDYLYIKNTHDTVIFVNKITKQRLHVAKKAVTINYSYHKK